MGSPGVGGANADIVYLARNWYLHELVIVVCGLWTQRKMGVNGDCGFLLFGLWEMWQSFQKYDFFLKLVTQNNGIAVRWMPLNTNKEKSVLV